MIGGDFAVGRDNGGRVAVGDFCDFGLFKNLHASGCCMHAQAKCKVERVNVCGPHIERAAVIGFVPTSAQVASRSKFWICV